MRAIWMGISPGPVDTRILAQDGPEKTLLKARLPFAPHHPRALATLCEAVALWSGRKVIAALDAGGSDGFCAPGRWQDTFEALTEGPLFRVEYVAPTEPPSSHDEVEGLGDFRDVRRLILVGAAR